MCTWFPELRTLPGEVACCQSSGPRVYTTTHGPPPMSCSLRQYSVSSGFHRNKLTCRARGLVWQARTD